MRPLLSPSQMAAADEAAIAAGTPAEVLMDRAGRAVARSAIALAGGRYGKRFVVVCGKGNNAGDGFVAARELLRAGGSVTTFLLNDPTEIRGGARLHLDRLTAAGARVGPWAGPLPEADVVIDAIFGTGFHGGARDEAAKAIEAINDSPTKVIAVDIPSGVDGSTGDVETVAVKAHLTIAIAAEKVGSAVGAGAACAGAVRVVDIGIPVTASGIGLIEAEDVVEWLRPRGVDAHKRSSSVLLIAGSDEMRGAALLAARGAARMGAGYVTLATTGAVKAAAAEAIPEAVVHHVSSSGTIGPEAIEWLSTALGRADAVGIGPGLGEGDAQREMVTLALREIEVPVVLDADALNVIADDPAALVERGATRSTVITPHPGEMARLLGLSAHEIGSDRPAAARRAAERFGCTVLLKGSRTVICTPRGDSFATFVNPTGGPELATAGTGDVLTGALCAVLARKVDPPEAASAAAYVHGVAGSVAGREMGRDGVVASDVADALSHAAQVVRSAASAPLGDAIP